MYSMYLLLPNFSISSSVSLGVEVSWNIYFFARINLSYRASILCWLFDKGAVVDPESLPVFVLSSFVSESELSSVVSILFVRVQVITCCLFVWIQKQEENTLDRRGSGSEGRWFGRYSLVKESVQWTANDAF